jgi:hypothetical protein
MVEWIAVLVSWISHQIISVTESTRGLIGNIRCLWLDDFPVKAENTGE